MNEWAGLNTVIASGHERENVGVKKNEGAKKRRASARCFFVPGPRSPPLLPRGMWLANRIRGDAQAQGAAMRPRRARDPTRGGHCPRRGGSLRKRQTPASRGCGGSECDWRTGSVGHELASCKRSAGRGAMGDACGDAVKIPIAGRCTLSSLPHD